MIAQTSKDVYDVQDGIIDDLLKVVGNPKVPTEVRLASKELLGALLIERTIRQKLASLYEEGTAFEGLTPSFDKNKLEEEHAELVIQKVKAVKDVSGEPSIATSIFECDERLRVCISQNERFKWICAITYAACVIAHLPIPKLSVPA